MKLGRKNLELDASRLKVLLNSNYSGMYVKKSGDTMTGDLQAPGVVITNGITVYKNGINYHRYAATEAGFAAAMIAAAATAGSVIDCNYHTIAFTAGIIIQPNVTVRNLSGTFSGFTGNAVTMGSNSTAWECFISIDGTGFSNAYAFYANGVSGVTIYRCNGLAFGASGHNFGIEIAGIVGVGQNYIEYSDFRASGADARGIAIGDYAYVLACTARSDGSDATSCAIYNDGTATDGWVKNSTFYSPAGNAAWLRGKGYYYNCSFNGYAYGVKIESGAQITFGDCAWSGILNAGTIIYAAGDRSAYGVDVYDYHAEDIESATPIRHTALPGNIGNILMSDGSKWTSVTKGDAGIPTGTGTAGRVVRWGAGNTLTDANLIGPASDVLTLAAGGAYTLTVPATGTAALGTGAANRAAFWSGANALTYDDAFTWDNTNKRLGLGLTAPTSRLHVKGTSSVATVGTSSVLTADGTFATSTGWTVPADWTVGSNKALHTSGGGTGMLEGTTTATLDTLYQINFTTADRTTGSLGVTFGVYDAGVTITSNAAQTVYVRAGGENAAIKFIPTSNYNGSVTDVTIYAVTPSTPDVIIEASNGASTPIEVRQAGHNLYNTAVGQVAGSSIITGTYNTAFGARALRYNTVGIQNMAVGANALYNNTTGYENMAIGYAALLSNKTGYYNVAIGSQSMYTNLSGINNVAIGRYALFYNATGNNNVAIGLNAGRDSIGTGNVFIGLNAGLTETASNKLYIANNSTAAATLIWGDFATKHVNIGGVTTDQNATLVVRSDGTNPILKAQNSAGTDSFVVDATGGVVVNEDGTATNDLRVETDTEANMLLVDASADKLYLGGSTNGIEIIKGAASNIKLLGTAKAKLSLRPQLYAGRVGGVSKPTFVSYGANAGYSFPIFSSDDEELFFREHIPGRWDGASDITGYIVCCLSGAEDVNDDFAFQLSWANKSIGAGVIVNTTTDVTTTQNVESGRAAAYSIYILAFTIDWDGPATDVAVSDHFAGRIRRVASGGTEVSNEIILLDFYMTYTVDKMYKTA